MIDLAAKMLEFTRQSCSDMTQYLEQLRALQDKINTEARALFGEELVSEKLMLVMLLGALPQSQWAYAVQFTNGGFTLDNVMRQLKGSEAVRASSSTKGQKNSELKQVNRSVNGGECFYCFGTSNEDKVPHVKRDCPLRASDRGCGIFKSNMLAKRAHVRVYKDKGTALKGKSSLPRKKLKHRKESKKASPNVSAPNVKQLIVAMHTCKL